MWHCVNSYSALNPTLHDDAVMACLLIKADWLVCFVTNSLFSTFHYIPLNAVNPSGISDALILFIPNPWQITWSMTIRHIVGPFLQTRLLFPLVPTVANKPMKQKESRQTTAVYKTLDTTTFSFFPLAQTGSLHLSLPSDLIPLHFQHTNYYDPTQRAWHQD